MKRLSYLLKGVAITCVLASLNYAFVIVSISYGVNMVGFMFLILASYLLQESRNCFDEYCRVRRRIILQRKKQQRKRMYKQRYQHMEGNIVWLTNSKTAGM